MSCTDIVYYTAEKLRVSLHSVSLTGEWPLHARSLSALLHRPAHHPSILAANSTLSNTPNELHSSLSRSIHSVVQNLSRWRELQPLSDHGSLWLSVIACVVRKTVPKCTVLINGKFALPNPGAAKDLLRSREALLLGLIPFTRNADGATWRAHFLQEAHSDTSASIPSSSMAPQTCDGLPGTTGLPLVDAADSATKRADSLQDAHSEASGSTHSSAMALETCDGLPGTPDRLLTDAADGATPRDVHSGTSTSVHSSATNPRTGYGLSDTLAETARAAMPDELYKYSPNTAQAHFTSSITYPIPLIPILCIATRADIVPLMCSAMHQRKALGCQDIPVLGITQDQIDSNSTLQILIGWMEESQSNDVEPMMHIATSLSAETRTSPDYGVFNLHDQSSALAFSDFLIRVGLHFATISSSLPPEQAVPGVDCKSLYKWRDVPISGTLSPGQLSDEWIREWNREVNECRASLYNEGHLDRGFMSPTSWQSLRWPTRSNLWLFEHDLKSDQEAVPGSDHSGSGGPGIIDWMLDHSVIPLPLPRACDGPVYDEFQEKVRQYLKILRSTTGSWMPENSDIYALATVVLETTVHLEGECPTLESWSWPWRHLAQWASREASDASGVPTKYFMKVPVEYLRSTECDELAQAYSLVTVSTDTQALGRQVLPYCTIYASMDQYARVIREEFRARRDAVLSGRDAVHSLDDIRPLWEFSKIMSQERETMSDTRYSYRHMQHLSSAFKHAYEVRMQDYRTRLLRYPTGSVVDASLAIIAPLNVDGQADQGFLDSITFYQLDDPVNSSSLHLPLLIVNHQRLGTELEVATINEQRMGCTSAARFLAALGIFDFPVYGLATYGTKGLVCQAWYSQSEGCCFIVDVDRDGTEFDIAEETGILRCADFFGMVNRSAADLLARFEQAKPSLLERLKSEEGRASLSWTSRSQLEEVWPGGIPPEVDGRDLEVNEGDLKVDERDLKVDEEYMEVDEEDMEVDEEDPEVDEEDPEVDKEVSE